MEGLRSSGQSAIHFPWLFFINAGLPRLPRKRGPLRDVRRQRKIAFQWRLAESTRRAIIFYASCVRRYERNGPGKKSSCASVPVSSAWFSSYIKVFPFIKEQKSKAAPPSPPPLLARRKIRGEVRIRAELGTRRPARTLFRFTFALVPTRRPLFLERRCIISEGSPVEIGPELPPGKS